MTFGDRVRYLRELSGATCVEIDALAGLGRGHTAQIESGARKNPTLRTLRGLAYVFGWRPGRQTFSLDWFVGGRGALPARLDVRAALEAARARVRQEVGPW